MSSSVTVARSPTSPTLFPKVLTINIPKGDHDCSCKLCEVHQTQPHTLLSRAVHTVNHPGQWHISCCPPQLCLGFLGVMIIQRNSGADQKLILVPINRFKG